MSQIRLSRLILTDLGGHKIILFLLICCVLSALAVIEVTHQTRQLSITQDKVFKERDALEMEWRNLLVEQRALSEHSRVEEIATMQLQMVRPTGQQDIVVDEP